MKSSCNLNKVNYVIGKFWEICIERLKRKRNISFIIILYQVVSSSIDVLKRSILDLAKLNSREQKFGNVSLITNSVHWIQFWNE